MMENLLDVYEELYGNRRCRDQERMERLIAKSIYKGTDCGLSVGFTKKGLTLSSIVEGVDLCTETIEVCYPFGNNELWDAVEKVEAQAEAIWNATHGCEDCGEEDPETGYIAINEGCKTCHGEGVII